MTIQKMLEEEEIAKKIVEEILADLNDRSGVNLDFDEDINNEMYKTLVDIVMKRLST